MLAKRKVKSPYVMVQEANPHLVTLIHLAKHYAINDRRLIGILIHPFNKAPEPEITQCIGKITVRLYNPKKINQWLNGRDIFTLPYISNARLNYFDDEACHPYKKPTDIGMGRQPVGDIFKTPKRFIGL